METNITPEFLTAFAKFQELCPTIEKDSTGHNYKYASLPQIVERVKPFLNQAGLVMFQEVKGEQELKIETSLFAVKGGGISSTFSVPLAMGQGKMSAIQSIGSNITYMRRYALSAILGIVTDEDKDGSDTGKFKNADEKEASRPILSQANLTQACERIKDGEISLYDTLLEKYKLTTEQKEKLKGCL
jgi:hypothetical protein